MKNLLQGNLNHINCNIGVITARFNSPVTEKLEKAAIERLIDIGWSEDNIVCVRVPGAVEVSLAAKLLIENGCEAIVALGAVIRGETSHFDYVCNSVERGCTQLMLETGCPIAFGILTTENADQAYARSGGAKGNKGAEAVDVAVEMLNLKKQIHNLTFKEANNV